jgi:hypothetical protein
MSDFYFPDFGGSYGFYSGVSSVASAVGPVLIVSFILGLCIAIFFLPQRNRGRFSPVLDKIHSFLNFRMFWLSWIIKVLFVTLSIYLFIMGIYVMFALSFWAGLALIISILVVRLVFESIYAILSIRDNVEQINHHFNGKPADDTPEEPSPRAGGGFSFKAFARRGPARPDSNEPVPAEQIKTADSADKVFCTNCSAETRPGAMFCANCGAKIQ